MGSGGPEPRYELVNLTRHELTVRVGPELLTVEPAAVPARIDETVEDRSSTLVNGFSIPLSVATVGNTTGLPDPKPDTFYFVSRPVALFNLHRDDLVVVEHDAGNLGPASGLLRLTHGGGRQSQTDRPSVRPAPTSGWQRLRALLAHVARTSWPAILIGLVLVALMTLFAAEFVARWEVGVSLVTLGSVWLIAKRRGWLDSLPKRLTVHLWEPAESGVWTWVGAFEDAYLSGESDIRAAAQALGRILLGKDLVMEGHFYLIDEEPPPTRSSGMLVRSYEVHIPMVNQAGNRMLFGGTAPHLVRNAAAIQTFDHAVDVWREG